MTVPSKHALLLSLGLVPALALAQSAAPPAATDLELRIERCSVLGDASARLACYDALAKTGPALKSVGGAAVGVPDPGKVSKLATALTQPSSTQPDEPPAAPLLPPKVAAITTIPPEDAVSRMVQWWELDRSSKRGVFNFRPHHDTYLLLANYSTSSNDAPFENFTPAGIKSQHTELTYQLSFKMKMIEQAFKTPVDLWFGYTQNSFWQAYNRAASSPFRETNYQPELMLTTPLNLNLGSALDIRYLTLAVMHQSNGQTSTLSRSWNRVYAEVGAEHGKLAAQLRIWKRLDNARSDNDNIDIVDYLGHGDLNLSYRSDGHEFSLMARHNFKNGRGALQAGWAYPVVANLKGYLQLFNGYGQSLIDYNYKQKSVGAGFLVDF
ncbi:phospholipase A [Duganella sp. BJB1802]|uniref:phospholipase A n=1 Tax=Duganella sp. BJB1802 TaxID=2744575 RepID=UPI0015946340|nr:phospholipase A [Duganella sp. BJB1802]NVD71682.1 phospholipase A [Duganella sp. BJB1802]